MRFKWQLCHNLVVVSASQIRGFALCMFVSKALPAKLLMQKPHAKTETQSLATLADPACGIISMTSEMLYTCSAAGNLQSGQ